MSLTRAEFREVLEIVSRNPKWIGLFRGPSLKQVEDYKKAQEALSERDSAR